MICRKRKPELLKTTVERRHWPPANLIVLICLVVIAGDTFADIVPSPGHYEGTTSQGNSVSFEVTADRKVKEFCITLDYTCDACGGSKEMCFEAQQFAIPDTCFWYSVITPNNFECGGCFITTSYVSGFFYYTSDQQCGTCNDYVTWEATCQDCARSLTVLVPNGGEKWTVGQSQTIQWRSTGEVTHLRILYSIDDGASWLTVTDSTENSGLHPWVIPDSPSSLCLVRIIDFDDTTVADVSDELFSICVQPSITVLIPNGGEGWNMGAMDTIRWIWEGCIDSVKIEYSVDGGLLWKSITKSAPNTGIFEWLVPNTPSQQAYVRVADAAEGTVRDSSDSPFRICLPSLLTLRTPNGGEKWNAGSMQLVSWASTGCIDSVGLAYSVNDGTDWTVIVSSTPNTASYSWMVPNEVSSLCRVQVWDAGDTTVFDVSDDPFAICASPTLQLLMPNGGEILLVDSTFSIRWQSTGCLGDVGLSYSVDVGQSWLSIASETPDDGLFSWIVPNTPSSQCLVRIRIVEDTLVFDVSDSLFSIEPTPMLTVLSPNGGEEWMVGSAYEILWQRVGSIEVVTIDYSIDGGMHWTAIAESVSGAGAFEWIVPPTPSSLCLVRVADLEMSSVADTSDSFFTITEPRMLTLISPNGGEVWEGGSVHDIVWTSTGVIDSVGIAYSLDGGQAWIPEVLAMANLGAYSWLVPDTFSVECLVRVEDIGDSGAADTSEDFFEITITPELRLHSPNGGEVLIVDSQFLVEWDFRGPIVRVAIEYSFTGGLSWITVIDSWANDGAYQWRVPATPSLVCLVRIADIEDPGVADTSDSFFTIRAAPSITVLSPNGGEAWRVGDVHEIRWSSTGLVSPVTIAYATHPDSQWMTIVTGSPNDGSFNWTLPNTPSTECRLRIFDTNVPAVADTSDSSFTVLPLEVTLRVIDGAGHQGAVNHQVAVAVENRMGLGLLHFSLVYEPTALALGTVTGTERVADMSRFWWNQEAPGSLRVMIDDGLLAAGIGPIAFVSFDVRINAPLGDQAIDLQTCTVRDSLLRETFLCLGEDGILTVLPQQTFSIEGFVRDEEGDGLENVTVTLIGDTSHVVTTSAIGQYRFEGLVDGEYLVLPSRPCWTFQPPSRRYASLDSNYTQQHFIGYTLGRSVLGWGDGVGGGELRDGALEDTFAVWYGPSLPCSLHAVEMAFGSPGTIMMFVWEASSDAPRDGIAPQRGTFPGNPLGDVVVGPVPFTVQGSGDWERLEFDHSGSVPVLGDPDEPGRSFFVGWVKVVPGTYPHNIPHILSSNVHPELTHSWFGGPWTASGGVDPEPHLWGAYDTASDAAPNAEYALRLDVSFPWCPSVVSVGLPETRGVEGDTLSLPMYVYSIVTGMDIRSYACQISFDATLLEFMGCVSQSSDMTSDWERPICNAGIPGTLLLVQNGLSALVGNGTLIHIRFRLLSSWKECSELTFVSFTFDGGDPPVRTENGRICVDAGSQRCNISGYVFHYANDSPVAGADITLYAGHADTVSTDEAGYYLYERLLCTLNDTVCAVVSTYPTNGVTGYDAALVAQAAVGLNTLSPLQQIAGDVSANCAVTAYDAALIAQRAAGLLSELPAGPWVLFPEKETITKENWCDPPLCMTHTPLAMDRDGQDFVAVPVGDVSGNWSPTGGMTRIQSSWGFAEDLSLEGRQHVALPLRLPSDEEILAIDLTLSFDPLVVMFDSVSTTEGMDHFERVCNRQPGRVQIILYGLTPVQAPPEVLKIWLTVIGKNGDVCLFNTERCLINEKSLIVPPWRLLVTGALPEVYAVEQNVPNPFNPETSIRYQLPNVQSPAQTVLTVFNILGQEVRTLVNEVQGAGRYTVLWDGRDARGCEVPSGIYWYRLVSGEFVQTKKMICLR